MHTIGKLTPEENIHAGLNGIRTHDLCDTGAVLYYSICIFHLLGYITKSQYNQLHVGLIAQLVEHCTKRTWVRVPFRPDFSSGFNFRTA